MVSGLYVVDVEMPLHVGHRSRPVLLVILTGKSMEFPASLCGGASALGRVIASTKTRFEIVDKDDAVTSAKQPSIYFSHVSHRPNSSGSYCKWRINSQKLTG